MTATGFSGEVLVLGLAEFGPSHVDPVLPEECDASEPHLADLFVQQARNRLNSIALSAENRDWSYKELLLAAYGTASAIRSNPQFAPGSRILLLISNSIEYVAAFYGTLLAGGVVVPLPPTLEKQGFERICESTDAVAVIVAEGARRLPAILNDLPKHRVSMDKPAGIEPPSVSIPCSNVNDLAAIFFTSGSTGDPKGVMLSHRNLIENAVSIQQYLEINESDRPLCALPFYHAFGNSVLQSHVLAGATLILDGKTLFPETLVTAIARHRVTSLSGVPDFFRLMLERTSLGRSALPSLRYMAVAGGALPHEIAVELSKRIDPARFYVMYGQTEATARLAFLPPECLKELPSGCIGRAIPGVELEVVDERGCRINAGETGEIRALGSNVMLGYWKDPAGTAERIRDGWLYTGDLATTDDRGWIYHRGRQNAIVKIAGFRVHPGDLEEFAVRRLCVKQAVAVPFEQPQVGLRLALFVSPSDIGSLSNAAMLVRCREELPRHLVPSFVREIEEFPMNSSMKIDRICLSQIALQESPGARPHLDLDLSVVKGVGS
jgi:long-chain acyl-CoA synthetase